MAGDRSRSDTNSSDSTTSFDMRKEQKELEAEEPKVMIVIDLLLGTPKRFDFFSYPIFEDFANEIFFKLLWK